MELQNLTINKNASYDKRPGEYTGSLRYQSQYGTVEIPLDHALSTEVLKLVGASMVRASKDIADNLTAEVFDVKTDNLLESQA